MMKDNKIDSLLRKALSPSKEPDFWLNQKIVQKAKENQIMDKYKHKIPKTAAILALTILLISVTAFAAWKLLSPKDVADTIQDSSLASAFESQDAIEVNKTQINGDYRITLLGAVSGKDLSDFASTANDEILHDRTYAIVAIARKDGTPMPDTKDENYDETPFFVSPLIHGEDPTKFNIMTMNGGYSAIVKDGILYRIIECDNVQNFAKQGVYICVCNSTFYDRNAYCYDKKTGDITRNESYNGVNALFTLPLDPDKADEEAGKRYLADLEASFGTDDDTADTTDTSSDTGVTLVNDDTLDTPWGKKTFSKLLEISAVVEKSVQNLTPDNNGMIHYIYQDGKYKDDMQINVATLFPDGKPGLSSELSILDSGFYTFTKEADGTVTVAFRQVNDD